MSQPPPPLSVVVVDDEPPARDLLRQYLEGRQDVQVLRLCADGFEAVRAVEELAPDVLLLDIQMPKLDGFEVLELLESPPHVVFTTAYDEFALRAFEVEAADYLLKPFSAERLERALDKVRERIARDERPALDGLAKRRAESRAPLDRVLVRDGGAVHVVPRAEIDFVEARDDYVVLHAGGASHRKKQTLTALAELLGEGFVRIHRGYLLNLDRLRGIEPYAKDSRVAFLEDGTRLPVSRSGYARLQRYL